ncbi:MAG: nicotinate dehydrogenase subunit [Betaproteobacteria bacterium]|jgi:CO/xanthine dehydrogenase Mo-binding subunit|nr:nicotinate dehydrogenase subunit [Betaproteobacteria bacterium]
MNRREFMQASGALVVSSSFSFDAFAQAAKPGLVPGELDSWIAVMPDGGVKAFFGKMDMGQGLDSAVAQIVAEELDVGFDRVEVLMGDTATSCNQGGASGSTGVSNGARLLRKAAAEARRVLVEGASNKLGVPVSDLKVENGTVFSADKKTTYAELVGGKHFNHKVQWNGQTGNPMDIQVPAKPKPPAEYKVVGKPLPRRDVAWKVFGTGDYVTDVRVPGMLHARVIRPPRAACKVRSVYEGSIKAIRGAQVVREKDFVAVLAPREWDAVRAAQQLKVDWHAVDGAFPDMAKLYDHVRAAKVTKRVEEVKHGDVASVFAKASKIVEAEYEWPFQSHASMGPACAVADAKADRCTVWTGSQKPHFVRDGVARLLGLPQDKVHAIWVTGPGSYGRNDAGDAAMDAAFLSKKVGKPVRVQGMRMDGTAWDPKAPACVHRGRAAIDASGKVVAYEFTSKGFSRQQIATNESDPADSLVGLATGVAPKGTLIFGTPAESYGFENKLLAWETIPPLVESGCSPLRTSHLRDPVGPEIHFGSEQFIDEIARAAGEDPVAFRLKYLTNPRHAAVVKAVAEKAGWSSLGKGKGIAFAERGGTAVAVVAQVEVDAKTGRIWARKFTVAHDCGLIINPLVLTQTIEGNVVHGLSRTLFEEVRFDRDSVKSVDWASYPILEIGDAPETIDVVLIDRPEIAPTGAGEPTIRVIPAAVANAFFDATGKRLRRAPLDPERVKAALSA